MELAQAQQKQKLQSLKQWLHQFSGPAAEALIRRQENGDIQCLACGHRCLVKPGRDGVCRVRFNEGGELKVPFGYVAGVACDPIEKKPFFHVLPGSDAVSFGMLGCDLHCGYCFTPETVVMTSRGPVTFGELFESAESKHQQPDGEIALPAGLQTVAGSGNWRRIEAVFGHPYRGPLTRVRPYYLPAFRCTPDHSVYATEDPLQPSRKMHAKLLTKKHYLAVPKRVAAASGVSALDVAGELRKHQVTHKIPWELSAADRQMILDATVAGRTSAQIGAVLGKSASYIRHVRCKLAARQVPHQRTTTAICDGTTVRYAKEHRPGIPAEVALDESVARLLGYYCAEGSLVVAKNRPNSRCLNFSFGHDETDLAETVRELIAQCFGVTAALVRRSTTIAVASGKTSLGLLFGSLAGIGAENKRVPAALFSASNEIVAAFLQACVEGDGHRYSNGKISLTTVSRQLAYGLAFLSLRLGHMPSVYDAPMPTDAQIQGRAVRRQPHQYTVVWYEKGSTTVSRRIVETEDYYLIPLRSVSTEEYDGLVFNMQVEQEHNYLANLMLVANCQNWVTSQMLRDAEAVAPAKQARPEQIVELALQHRAPVIASTYNEPLITSEWAVEVFKAARPRGLKCVYISNGNGTPEVLDYLRQWVDAYKVDLKTFSDRNYRQLGGVLENITSTIRGLKERNFWVEIVTLVVPGFSDDPDDLKRMAEFLAGVDPLMPWHVTAFHPDYKMSEGYRQTTAEDLLRVVKIGQQAGLKYIYPGNLPGQVGPHENTRCHHCGTTLIKRWGFVVQANYMPDNGHCPSCHKPVPGIWGTAGGHGDGRVRHLA